MAPRSAIVFVCGVALGGTGVAGVLLAGRSGPPASVAIAPEAPTRLVASAPGAQAVPDLRPAIRARVAAVLAEQRRGHELDVFLDELAAAARAQGHVSALEVLSGQAAIEAAYPGDMERSAAFSRRMEDLAKELGQPPVDEGAPANVSAASLLQGVVTTPFGPARDKLVPAALKAISALPLSEQEDASRALDRATAAGAPEAAPPPAPEALLAQIAAAPDPTARRDLVERFLEATGSRSPEEQEQLLRQLDATTAAAASR